MHQSTTARHWTICSITQNVDGKKCAIYADSAYRSKAVEGKLTRAGITSHICEKSVRGSPLTEAQKELNREKPEVRARIEHIFGAQDAMGGHFMRPIGLLRGCYVTS
ncbi:MAG: hypothetical protein EPO43_10230 [Rugosibacter sp.]|nr:MAG: hypothetical protein EPO43_10230 [Rugosibacter sp.]